MTLSDRPADTAPDPPATARARASLWRMPVLVFVVALLATGSLSAYLLQSVARSDAVAFEHEATRTAQAMQERLDLTVTLLRGAAGLFEASHAVSRPEFAAYVARLRLRELYPGVLGIGYSQALQPQDVPAFERQARASLPAFRVWPEQPRAEITSILYLEPQDDRNRVALGFDMTTEPTRRAAMHAARDSGLPQSSGRVTLVQEIDEDKQAGFLIYLPLYRGGGVPKSEQARRDALLGYVYSPLRVGDLFRGSRGDDPKRLDYELFADLEGSPGSLLRRTRHGEHAAPRFRSEHLLHVPGRQWLVRFASRSDFDTLSPKRLAPGLALLSIATSLLLGGITLLQVRARRGAEQLAEAAQRNAALYDELATAARRKDEFLAMLGHELRNPLAPIVTAVDALQRGVPSDRAGRLYQIIGRQAQHLTHLVNDLLDAARITTGRITVRPVPMLVDEALHNAVEAMQPRLNERGQQLHVQHSGLPAPLVADPTRLTQVLINLLHNASKFSPNGASIDLQVDEQPEAVVFTVRDRGVGIEPAALSKVFELFAQAGERDPSHGGLGIGLALVKRLVELHGGTVTASSAGLGQGAEFTVRLPRAGAP